MNTTGKEGYEPIVQGLRPGLNDGEEPRSVDIDAAWGGEDAFIYSKLGLFVIVGFINIERPKEWQGTKIHVRRGIIEPQHYTLPDSFGDYLL
jgi:hypothetical protein